MSRKQDNDKAVADELRRVKEQDQGVVKRDVSPSMSFTTGVSLQGVDPKMAEVLKEWLKQYGK
jgi:hypothetical protein